MAIQGFGKANFSDIRDFELKNNIKLPNDYTNFLLNYNGSNVELTDQNSIYIKEFREAVNIDVLFGLKTKNPELSIELWLSDYKSEMPNDTLIIGASYQHGLIVLLCASEDTGVYYWDHAYQFPCSNDDSNTYFMADTFTDFVRGLI